MKKTFKFWRWDATHMRLDMCTPVIPTCFKESYFFFLKWSKSGRYRLRRKKYYSFISIIYLIKHIFGLSNLLIHGSFCLDESYHRLTWIFFRTASSKLLLAPGLLGQFLQHGRFFFHMLIYWIKLFESYFHYHLKSELRK